MTALGAVISCRAEESILLIISEGTWWWACFSYQPSLQITTTAGRNILRCDAVNGCKVSLPTRGFAPSFCFDHLRLVLQPVQPSPVSSGQGNVWRELHTITITITSVSRRLQEEIADSLHGAYQKTHHRFRCVSHFRSWVMCVEFGGTQKIKKKQERILKSLELLFQIQFSHLILSWFGDDGGLYYRDGKALHCTCSTAWWERLFL